MHECAEPYSKSKNWIDVWAKRKFIIENLSFILILEIWYVLKKFNKSDPEPCIDVKVCD